MKKNYLLVLTVIVFSINASSQNCNLFGNGNFESPVFTSTPAYFTSVSMGGWQTTSPDGQMELWNSGYNGVTSFSGVQHMEINGYYDSTVYQNIVVAPGTNLAISFAHRGRGAIDTLSISAGPVGGPYTTLGYFGDDEFTWGYYTVNYIVPNLGTNYSIRFNPVYAGVGIQGVGNFLDSVTVCITNVGVGEIEIGINSVSIFPNPSADNLSLTYYSEINEPSVSITIFNFNGAVVKKVITDFIAGKNKIDLHLKALNAGIYFIKIAGNKNTAVGKWVKF